MRKFGFLMIEALKSAPHLNNTVSLPPPGPPVSVNYRHWPVGISVYHFGITYFGIVIVIRSSLCADRRRLNKRIFSVVAGSCCQISVHIAAVSECWNCWSWQDGPWKYETKKGQTKNPVDYCVLVLALALALVPWEGTLVSSLREQKPPPPHCKRGGEFYHALRRCLGFLPSRAEASPPTLQKRGRILLHSEKGPWFPLTEASLPKLKEGDNSIMHWEERERERETYR